MVVMPKRQLSRRGCVDQQVDVEDAGAFAGDGVDGSCQGPELNVVRSE